MKKSISIKKVRHDAEEAFRLTGFYCTEALFTSIRKNIDPNMPASLISAASGFPIGVGRSRCMCGAVSGGVLALGYFFGRKDPSSDNNEQGEKCLALVNEMQAAFRKNHKDTLCCSIHVQGLDLGSGEHRAQCIRFTGECAAITAGIIARELKLTVTD